MGVIFMPRTSPGDYQCQCDCHGAKNDTGSEVQRSAEIVIKKKDNFASWFESPAFSSKVENVKLSPGTNIVMLLL